MLKSTFCLAYMTNFVKVLCKCNYNYRADQLLIDIGYMYE